MARAHTIILFFDNLWNTGDLFSISYKRCARDAPNRIMASKKVILKTLAQLFGPSIIVFLFFTFLSINSQISLSQSDIPTEIGYYEGVDGYYMESEYPWQDFMSLEGTFIQVSHQGLRRESLKVLNTVGVCTMFVDKGGGVMWLTGFSNVRMGEPTMFVFFWKTQPDESSILPRRSL